MYLIGYCLPIFECNSNCSCQEGCINRLTQKIPPTQLEIFQTKDKGLAVRTLQPILKAQYISEYSGELVSHNEAKLRVSRMKKEDNNYLLVLKEHVAEDKVLKTHIDATRQGNVTRFMNHSCEPNMDIVPVRVNVPVPKLCLFSIRNIECGEELTFHYNGKRNPNDGNSRSVKDNITSSRKCLCGTNSCSGYLPFDECLYNS